MRRRHRPAGRPDTPAEVADMERMLEVVHRKTAELRATLDRADAAAQRAEQQWGAR